MKHRVSLHDCIEFVAGDRTILREILHPAKQNVKIGYSLAHFRVLPGQKTAKHSLKTSEVYFIISGKGIMHIDNEVFEVESNDTIYIKPNSIQFIENMSKNQEIVALLTLHGEKKTKQYMNSEIMTFSEIDGSEGEGGGQMIRTAMTLSAITKKPVRIFNIRANRPNPGLQMQHLTAVKAVRNICRGTLTGAELGSKELIFHPGEIVGGKYEFDIGTAGSVTLVAQTILPILLWANKESELRIVGGTHVMKSPGYDYFENVFLPAISKFGAVVESELVKPGYYPKGGGEIKLRIKPSKLSGDTSWMQNNETCVLLRLSDLPDSIVIREKKIFVQNEIEKIFIRRDPASSPGNAVTAWRGYRGAYSLGEKGKRAEEVAKEALDMLNSEKEDVDCHLADQLLVYAALAEGKTEYKTSIITEHLRTNVDVIAKFLDRKIDIEGTKITCQSSACL